MSMPSPAGTMIVRAVDEHVEVRVHVVLQLLGVFGDEPGRRAPAPSDRSARATASGSAPTVRS